MVHLMILDVVPVQRAALEIQAPAHIGREPLAEAKIIGGCEMMLFAAVHLRVLCEEGVDTCAELDKPVLARFAVIMGGARHFLYHSYTFFHHNGGGFLGRCREAACKGEDGHGCHCFCFHLRRDWGLLDVK